jgi:hypothetical protein
MTTQLRLGDAVPQDAVWDACADIGFRLSNMVPRAAAHPAQAIFVSPDRQTLLHLIEDEAAGRIVVLRGARAEEATRAFAAALGGEGGAAERNEIARAIERNELARQREEAGGGS